MKGRITKEFQGFVKTTRNPLTNIEIEGVSYPYFLNNPELKEMVRNLKINDVVEFDVKDSKDFQVILNIKKIEVKEFVEKSPLLPTNNNFKQQPKSIRNDIKHGLAFKLTHYKWIFMKRIDPLTDEKTFLQDVDNTYNLMSK